MIKIDKKILMIAIFVVGLAAVVALILQIGRPRIVCGNDLCEIGEDSENCCTDCSCYRPGEICRSNKCVEVGFKLSEEKVKELVINYFEEKNQTVDSVQILGLFNWNNTVVESAIVKIEGSEGFINVIVTENEEVIPQPIR